MTVNSISLMDIGKVSASHQNVKERDNLSFDKTFNNMNKKGNSLREKPVNKQKTNFYKQENKLVKINTVENDNTGKSTANISEIVNKVQDIIKEELGLTDEELSILLVENGLVPIDLLDKSNFLQLILSVNNLDDISEIFINDEISSSVLELINEYNLLVTDEVIDYISSDNLNVDIDIEQDINFNTALKDNEKNPKINLNDIKNVEDDSDENNINKEISGKQIGQVQIINETNSKEMDSKQDNESMTREQDTDNLWNNLVNNIAEKRTETVFEVSNTGETRLEMIDIVNQIVERIKVVIKPDVTSMELQLNPENLGKVNLTVAEKSGQMTASFIVENQAAKEAIESQINVLINNLNEQGLKVEEVEVTLASYEFFNNQNQETNDSQSGSKNSNKKFSLDNDITSISDITEEEVIDNYDGISGNNVNYKA